jgi:hypothetical protein
MPWRLGCVKLRFGIAASSARQRRWRAAAAAVARGSSGCAQINAARC